MDTLLLIVGLLVLVAVAFWMRRSGVKDEVERREAEDAQDALDTTRRINDATRLPPDTDDARDWLRDFGGEASSHKR